jgi:hypothetical protein
MRIVMVKFGLCYVTLYANYLIRQQNEILFLLIQKAAKLFCPIHNQ